MVEQQGFNHLYKWLHAREADASAVLGGSATPALSLKELAQLSNDPEATKAVFKFEDVRFALGSSQGNAALRQTIADLYNTSKSNVNPAKVMVANSTTGINHIVHQSSLKPGDHVICQYPIYSPCIEEPQAIGCDISYLRLDPSKAWATDLQQLKDLIQPGKTKLLMLNSPNNPTGSYISSENQREIIKIAKQHDIIIHVDEIFRPLFHTDEAPTSFIEHDDLGYDKVVTTASMSKAFGMSGVRIGWLVTRSEELMTKFMSYRTMSCMSVSALDEIVANEALGPRCLPGILKKHNDIAKANIQTLAKFADDHKGQIDWVPPTAGAVVFLTFKDYKTGEPVDDVDFCTRALKSKKVLLSPGSATFVCDEDKNVFRGRIRIHFTLPPEYFKSALGLLGEFLDEEKSQANGEPVSSMPVR